ncbi:HlyD family secretion protein [Gallaecimonas pentaromativorans]|uniref:RND family efflux transporter MFP subunit n=1 Tax=Gallaecimonas pentaromativorans TaxID=584787 RepID=A0A3N1NK45_9GAMM|nr:HlyD family secretion protein [Gallaecimonas pentaromativorans]MED5526798.1 HlyD family secretion protein [Pseudomonadota bacterium]ROQ19122.1 RND family efflux transporter MFP subunit [Gallaecimonas pentaromativorans]
MGQLLRVLVTLLFVAGAILAGTWVWNHYLYSPWTRDGRVQADVATLAPDVSGWVTELKVHDNQQVKKGEVMFVIDDTRYKAVIAEDQAEVEKAKFAWDLAQHQYQRRKQLIAKKVISDEDEETYRINTDQAKASYDLAVAQLNAAQIDLARTVVTAPEDGTIINLTLRQGNYVSKGTPVMSLVKNNSFYVTGYFEETKLPLVHVGQKAKVHLMSGGKPLLGTVISISPGIANTNTNANNQLLPQVQQTFNWVRLAQRIPVDIRLDQIPEGVHLSAGMTVSVNLNSQD